MTFQETIQYISQIPIIQLILGIIIIYMIKLALSTYKSWLRYLQVIIIEKEYNISKKDNELKKMIIERLGQSNISKAIEKRLKKTEVDENG